MKSNPVRFGRAIVLSSFFFVTVFALFGVEQNPAWVTAHIWAGALLLIGSTVHLLTNLNWVKAAFFCPGKTLQKRVRQNRFIDLGMLISGSACAVTGALRLFSRSDPAVLEGWARLHTMSGICMIVLVGLHLLLHWQWMVNTAQQLRETPSAFPGKAPLEDGGS